MEINFIFFSWTTILSTKISKDKKFLDAFIMDFDYWKKQKLPNISYITLTLIYSFSLSIFISFRCFQTPHCCSLLHCSRMKGIYSFKNQVVLHIFICFWWLQPSHSCSPLCCSKVKCHLIISHFIQKLNDISPLHSLICWHYLRPLILLLHSTLFTIKKFSHLSLSFLLNTTYNQN